MHLLIPYHRHHRDRVALDEACRLAHPDDTITVLSSALVPACYPVDVIPGVIWKQTCTADRRLSRARAYLAPRVADDVTVSILRVQARDECAAIIAGAQHREVDLILFGGWPAPFARIAARFGTAGTVAQHVRCGVQVVPAAPQSAIASPAETSISAVDECDPAQTIPGGQTRHAREA